MVLHVVDRAGWLGAITMGRKMNFENEQACSPDVRQLLILYLLLLIKEFLLVTFGS